MSLIIILAPCLSLCGLTERGSKLYGATLGLLVGVAMCFALHGISLSSVLDRMDMEQLRGAQLHSEIGE
jgi:hypothetical protein